MIKAIDAINFAAAISGLIIALMGLFFTLSLSYLNRTLRKFFVILFSLVTAYVASDFLSQISLVFLGSGYALLSRIAVFCESLFSSMLMPVLTMFILRCSGERRKRTPVFSSVLTLWLVYVALLVFTQFTTQIYTITPDNVYRRGPWYFILLIPPAVMTVINCFTLYFRRKNLSRRQCLAFSLYLLIPLVCMLIQMFFYGLLMIVIGTTISALILFLFMLSDHINQELRQREENAAQRASIIVLQMRPHFIYNTLMSIYYLCKQDADQAQKVILDFTSYLRKNFSAIAKEDIIPFSEEMEHTKAYLAVEQVRFQEGLKVRFDTRYTAFRIPPLTLQPIAENAVKHGLNPEWEALEIDISTRKTDEWIEIIVKDNGPGFKPADEDNPQIALKNIRERLDLMCKGTLTIESGEEGGTVVTIRLPGQAEDHQSTDSN
jgi:sensor histidine kinase YesM